MSRPSMEIVQEAIAKLENMSSEEFHFSIFGFSKEDYEAYIKNDFKKDIESIKWYINKSGYGCRAYEDKVEGVQWRKFCRAFSERSENVEEDNEHYFSSFNTSYAGLNMNVVNGQGTITTFTLKKEQ